MNFITVRISKLYILILLDKQPAYSKFRFIYKPKTIIMKRLLFLSLLFTFIHSLGQETTIIKTPAKAEATDTKVFYSQKLVNTKTVEVLRKGILEFNVAHNFGDISGDAGGINNFYGLDNASD